MSRPYAPRTLFVASTGGHLMQLTRLAPRIETLGAPIWATFDTPQSRSLLANEETSFVRFIAPRDFRNVVRNVSAARAMLRAHDVVEVISTGSGVALSFIPAARLQGIPCHYIESAARSRGPSITGRALATVPGVQLYSQYNAWASRRWKSAGSVFDEFAPGPTKSARSGRLSVFVALGTLDFRFDRLVEAVSRASSGRWDLTWQVGPNEYRGLTGDVHGIVEANEFSRLCRRADVVISHAGVGSALSALEAGQHPLLVARDAHLGEHVDSHQALVSYELSERGVASAIEPLDLDALVVENTALKSVRRQETASAIRIHGAR